MTTSPRPRPTRTHRSRSPLLARLDAEWAHLRTCRRALRTARAWGRDLPPGHPLAVAIAALDAGDDGDGLDHILRATQRRLHRDGADDRVLLALVELARTDELAGRIVLQHLLPGLIVAARRYWSPLDQVPPIELAVPAAWVAIRSYDVARRQRFVASSLLSDAVFQAFRRTLRQRSATEEACAPERFDTAACTDEPLTAADELAVVLREARRAGVPTHDLDLLRQLVRVGSPGLVAQQREVTPRTVRNHRDRAVERVRLAVAA